MIEQLTASLIECWRKRGESLPLVPEAFDAFNRDIHNEVLKFEFTDSKLALDLAQLQVEINRRIYNAKRA